MPRFHGLRSFHSPSRDLRWVEAQPSNHPQLDEGSQLRSLVKSTQDAVEDYGRSFRMQ
jgi:hypothetical protein